MFHAVGLKISRKCNIALSPADGGICCYAFSVTANGGGALDSHHTNKVPHTVVYIT